MAESVDALVSNTSGFTSIPVRPRVWVRKEKVQKLSPFFMPSAESFFVSLKSVALLLENGYNGL